MTKKLIALAVIAAGLIAADSAEIAKDTKFEAPDDVADKLVADGLAKPDDEAKPAKAEKKVPVRLLVDGVHGNANDVVELDPATAKQLKASGEADDDKGAVAYARSLPQNTGEA
ncbi:MAG: hypothetical protein JSR41_09985 [Proteobacteria bacterium]|nr:hypothetical protein [Pseudomonadota bacterium]